MLNVLKDFSLPYQFAIKVSLIFLTSGFSFYSLAQNTGSLKGQVVDLRDREPLAGTSLLLVEPEKSCVSDSTGVFHFNDLPTGIYTLRVSYLGYISKTIASISVLAGKQLSLNITLEEDVKLLGAVEVRSFRFENDKTSPISTFSFSREEIALNPGAQGDVFRAIGMLPGVTSSGGIYSAIAVRGQGVRDNVYLVDDIPVTEVGHLEGNSFFNDPNGGRFSIFAPRVIDQAVYIGGAFGAEYGRRSASYLGLSIKEGNKGSSIVDGQVDLLGANINYDGPSPISSKTNLFASARYQNFLPLVKIIGLENLGVPSYGDYIIKTSTSLNPKNKLSTLFMISPERFVRDMSHFQADKEFNLVYLPDFRRNKIISGINLQSFVGKKSLLKNVLYYTNYSSDVAVGRAYPKVNSQGQQAIGNIDFKDRIQTQRYREDKWGFRSLFETSFFKSDRLKTGLEADLLRLVNERRLLENDTLFVFRRSGAIPIGQNYQVLTPALINADFNSYAPNVSAYLSYYFEPAASWSIQTGLRYDYTGFSRQHVWAPRVQLSHHLSSNQSLSIGYGWYYQEPVYADVADLPGGNRLKMEKVTHLIFAYKIYFKNDQKLTLELWHKEFTSMVVTPLTGTVFRNNNGKGYGRGADLSYTKRLSTKWHGVANYSFMQVMRNDQDGEGYYPFTFSQPHQINLMISYVLNDKFSFSGKYRWASGRPKDAFVIHQNVLNDPDNYLYSMELIGRNRQILPYFSSLDFRVNYTFRSPKVRYTAFFDVVNVLNRQIANSESFNFFNGKPYFDGLAIFPTGGLKFEF